MSKIVAVLAVIIGVLGFVVLKQQRTIQNLQSDRSGTGSSISMSLNEDALRKENQLVTDELASLRKNQRELARLRGEIGVLRKFSQSTPSMPMDATAAHLSSSLTNETETPSESPILSTNTYTVNTKAKLENGQTLIAGGWQIAPGKRYYVLATPQISGNEQPSRISVNTLFVEGPDEILTGVGLDFGPAGRDSFASRILAGEQSQALLDKLLSTSGVDILTSPAISTLSGRNAMLNAEEVKPATDQNAPAFSGPIIQVTPTLAEDGQSVDLHLVGQIIREGL